LTAGACPSLRASEAHQHSPTPRAGTDAGSLSCDAETRHGGIIIQDSASITLDHRCCIVAGGRRVWLDQAWAEWIRDHGGRESITIEVEPEESDTPSLPALTAEQAAVITYLREHGVTPAEELAEKIGFSVRTLSRWCGPNGPLRRHGVDATPKGYAFTHTPLPRLAPNQQGCLAYIREHGPISADDLATPIGYSAKQIKRWCGPSGPLRAYGVRPTGRGYVATDAPPIRKRRTLTADECGLLNYLREHGVTSAEDLARVMGYSPQTIKRWCGPDGPLRAYGVEATTKGYGINEAATEPTDHDQDDADDEPAPSTSAVIAGVILTPEADGSVGLPVPLVAVVVDGGRRVWIDSAWAAWISENGGSETVAIEVKPERVGLPKLSSDPPPLTEVQQAVLDLIGERGVVKCDDIVAFLDKTLKVQVDRSTVARWCGTHKGQPGPLKRHGVRSTRKGYYLPRATAGEQAPRSGARNCPRP